MVPFLIVIATYLGFGKIVCLLENVFTTLRGRMPELQ